MINWQAHPLLRISLCFIVGIILQGYIKLSLSALGFTIATILTATYVLWNRRNHHLRKWTTLLILILYICSGMMRVALDSNIHRSALLPLLEKEGVIVSGRVVEIKPSSSGTCKITLKADHFISQNHQSNHSEKIILFLKDNFQHIHKLDYVSTEGILHEITSPKNPYGFDYKKHLARKHIYHSLYINKNEISVVRPPCSFHVLLNSLRNQIHNHIKKYVHDEDARALSYGMILGDRKEISDELSTTFKSTGSMHTLAVSGLHVGIIAALIGICFAPFRNKYISLWIKPVVMLMSIWTFALVSGSSPSVLRAACMFSFFIWKFHWSENKNPYNLLAVSAFILLLLEPLAIYQVSFQFSYLAMLGILLFAPILKSIQKIDHVFLRYTCSLAIVSMAAQCMILPLSLYYFSSAPIYFIFWSLISIPATFVIVSLNIVGIVAHFISKPLAEFAGELVDSSVKLVTHMLSGIESLPFSSTETLHLDAWEVCIIYSIISAIIYSFYTGKKTIITLTSLLLFSWFMVRKIATEKKRDIPFVMVYDDYKVCSIDVFLGNHVIAFYHEPQGQMKPHEKLRKAYGISDEQVINDAKQWRMGSITGNHHSIKTDDESVLLLGSDFLNPIKADILIITSKSSEPPQKTHSMVLPKRIILTPGVQLNLIEKWNTYAKQHKIKIYNVRTEGSLKLLL